MEAGSPVKNLPLSRQKVMVVLPHVTVVKIKMNGYICEYSEHYQIKIFEANSGSCMENKLKGVGKWRLKIQLEGCCNTLIAK